METVVPQVNIPMSYIHQHCILTPLKLAVFKLRYAIVKIHRSAPRFSYFRNHVLKDTETRNQCEITPY